MIFLTGDTHGTHDIQKIVRIHNYIDANDLYDDNNIVIVLGDFGYGWNPIVTKEMEWIFTDAPFTILFVDGNHENHDYLAALPRATRFNGEVGVIQHPTTNIYHLLRGGIYTIEGHTFYTLGGAHSQDIARRTPPIYTAPTKIWWAEELPTLEFLDTLKTPTSVDFILTHQAPQRYFPIDPTTRQPYAPDPREEYFLAHLNNLELRCEYKKWFFGHWHVDAIMQTYTEKCGVALYNKIYCLHRDKTDYFI
jgi:hypothetical protein